MTVENHLENPEKHVENLTNADLDAKQHLKMTFNEQMALMGNAIRNGVVDGKIAEYRDAMNKFCDGRIGGNSLPIPLELLINRSQRARNAFSVTGDSGTKGDKLVDSQVLFEYWQNHNFTSLPLERMGITQLTGLVDDISLPQMATRLGANFLGESATVSPTDSIITLATSKPHRVSSRFEITDYLDRQTSGLTTQYLLESALDSIDESHAIQIVRGTGTGVELDGIINTSGVTEVNMFPTGDGKVTASGLISFLQTASYQDAESSKIRMVINPTFLSRMLEVTADNVSGADLHMPMKTNLKGVPVYDTTAFEGDINDVVGACGDFSSTFSCEYGMPIIIVDRITGQGSGKIFVTINKFVDIIYGNKRDFVTGKFSLPAE